jgi:predicted Zn-dependent protease
MKMFRSVVEGVGLLLFLFLSGGSAGSFAQHVGKKTEAGLSEKERLANTALFVDAVKERLNENYDMAEEMLHRVILTEPSHDAAHYELAILMVMKGRMQEALQEAETAASYNPENPWYKVMLGDLYNQSGQFRQAEEYWKELSEKYPDNLDYLNNFAFSLTQQNRLKEALKVYDAMQSQLGLNEQLCETKKNIWVYLKKPDAAVSELKPLMEAFPGETKYYLEAAQVYFTFNQEKKGVACLEAARRADSTDGQLLMTLYDYYVKHKKNKEALVILQQIVGNPAIPIEPKSKVLTAYYIRAQQDLSCYGEVCP